jgi:purine nucleosidase
VEGEHAVNALIRLGNESPGELTLVAIGPLTNLALATRLDPSLPDKYAQLVVMGGAIRGVGNVTLAAEFNFYADPEAAAVVLGAWRGLTLVSWETTMDHAFSVEQRDELLAVDTPRGEFFRRITTHTMEVLEKMMGRGELYEPDLLAVAVALEPDIIKEAEAHYVQVELAGVHTRGQTIVDWSDRSGNEPNVNLVLKMNKERLWEMIQAAVR